MDIDLEDNKNIQIQNNLEDFNQKDKLENQGENLEQPQGESISGLVNKELAKQLVEMGFSKNVSEKALFLNQQVLEKAIEWIYENQDKPDFEEELRLMGKSE
mgnify:CR=1 FL=1